MVANKSRIEPYFALGQSSTMDGGEEQLADLHFEVAMGYPKVKQKQVEYRREAGSRTTSGVPKSQANVG